MITVVGLGPGEPGMRTREADAALLDAELILGYEGYVDRIREEFPDTPMCTTGMTRERERCALALEHSRRGERVAVVCSGDPGVYGMASLLLEMADSTDEIRVLPGVTAALAASAALGAPISQDFAVVSLSDRLTPRAVIEKRLRACAAGDLVVALYNPGSRGRKGMLSWAAGVFLETLPGDRICGVVRMAGTAAQTAEVCTLRDLASREVDMFTLVILGNSETRMCHGKMVTPRGYRL